MCFYVCSKQERLREVYSRGVWILGQGCLVFPSMFVEPRGDLLLPLPGIAVLLFVRLDEERWELGPTSSISICGFPSERVFETVLLHGRVTVWQATDTGGGASVPLFAFWEVVGGAPGTFAHVWVSTETKRGATPLRTTSENVPFFRKSNCVFAAL